MRPLLKFAHLIDRLSEILGKISILLILVLVVVGFYNVLARYIGRFVGQNLSSNRLIEIQWYIYSVIFFLIFAYNVKHDVNVRVDILYAKWSPQRKAWVDFLGTLLILIPFCLIGPCPLRCCPAPRPCAPRASGTSAPNTRPRSGAASPAPGEKRARAAGRD